MKTLVVIFIAFQLSIASAQTLEEISSQIDSLQNVVKTADLRIQELKSIREKIKSDGVAKQGGVWLVSTGSCYLRPSMSSIDEFSIPKNTKLFALGATYDGDFIKVKYNDKIYFINRIHLKISEDSLNTLVDANFYNTAVFWIRPIFTVLTSKPDGKDSIFIARQGMTLTVLENQADWCKVQTSDNIYEGWIKRAELSGNKVKLISKNDFRRELFCLTHTGISMKLVKAIREAGIILGMTREMVIASWGEPQDVHRTAGSWGIHEQWIYGNNQYVYFENDILTSWQD